MTKYEYFHAEMSPDVHSHYIETSHLLALVPKKGECTHQELAKKTSVILRDMPISADTTDTIIYSDALLPIPKECRNNAAALDSVVKRDIWWGEALEKFDRPDSESYPEHWREHVMLADDGREAGDLLPFRLNADDYVASLLLVCFAVAMFLIARSQHYLLLKGKEFFRSSRRENMFNDSSDERMLGKYFFSFLLCVSLSILMFNYQQIHFPKLLEEVSPYFLLGTNLVCLGVGYTLRTIFYAFVNTVFFERDRNEKWMESYHLLTVAANLLFFPIALLVVFYELDFSNWQILFSFSVIIVEIFLILKTYHIFFGGKLGPLHLILYLCTLEFLPLLTLWKGMVWVTQELTKLV